MAGPTPAFWQQHFETGSTPWDRGEAGPHLQRWLASGAIAPGQRVVVPGCGSGWEVAALAAAGVDVVGLDYVEAAVERTRTLLAAHGLAAEVAQADVLQWQPAGPVDAVYEQTCLCALHPDHWRAYATQLGAWVRPGGRLLALFMQKREASAGDGVVSGPPYHCDIHAMRALFPSTDWAWPKPPYVHVAHPSGAYELAVELVRQSDITETGDTMDFKHSQTSLQLQQRVRDFMEAHVYPAEHVYYQQVQASDHPYRTPAVLQELKALAQAQGLWNLFLSSAGGGLSNLDYAPVKEIMGRVLWAPEVFNCSAPDTGNMEVLSHYGTPAQKAQWLDPLMAGTIRSAFSMTEPAVASSDATNIQCEIRRDGDDYVINGRKWFTSGALNEECTLLIVMGKTDPDHADRHRQQSMILVPKNTPGVRIVRDITAFGYDDAPVGHPEIVYDNVRVPASNMLLGEGRGFEIAQGRLGPGRIHHCMRLIGCAQRALEMMCERANTRVAFGRALGEQGSVREDIAHSFCEIEQARLLTLHAADKMDREGNKVARDLIAAAKIVVPSMAARVIDRAIQVFGGAGVSQDTFLPRAYVYARFIRIGDGPDQVHLSAIGKDLLKRSAARAAA